MKYFDWLAQTVPHQKKSLTLQTDMNVGMSDYDYFMSKAPVRGDEWASDMLAESERRG